MIKGMALITKTTEDMDALIKFFSPDGYDDCQFIIQDGCCSIEPMVFEAGFYHGIPLKNCITIHEEKSK